MLDRTLLLCLVLGGAWLAVLPASAQEAIPEPPVVTVGILIDGPWNRNDEITEIFTTEVTALTELDYDVRFPDDKHLVSDWTVDGVRADFDRLLADPEVDIVFTMGVLGSNEAIQRRDLPKPVIAPFVIDYEFLGANRSRCFPRRPATDSA